MISSSKSHYQTLEEQKSDPQKALHDPPRTRRCNMVIATFLLLFSSAFYVNGNFFIKGALSANGGLFTLQFLRHSISCVFLYVYATLKGEKPLNVKDKATAKVLAWRGTYGLANSVCGAAGLALIVSHYLKENNTCFLFL